MKIVKTSMIELMEVSNIMVFPEDSIWDSQHENFNKDVEVLVTSDGFVYKANSIKSYKIDDIQIILQIMTNDNLKTKFILNEYSKHVIDELEMYINDETFINCVHKFLRGNKTFTKLRLSEALNIDKPITNKLVTYLIANKFVETYYSYFKVII